MILTIDQYGQKTLVSDIKRKTLKEKFYGGAIHKMYRDTKEGQAQHVGYTIGQGRGNVSLWLECFKIEPINKV
jgi:hypothetical protein